MATYERRTLQQVKFAAVNTRREEHSGKWHSDSIECGVVQRLEP